MTEAADNYRQSVLSAFRDVEDNLAAQHQLGIEGVTRAAATEAADRALKQAQLRYQGGIVTYLEVVSTENAYLQSALSMADIAARRMTHQYRPRHGARRRLASGDRARSR